MVTKLLPIIYFFTLIPTNSSNVIECEPLLIQWVGGEGTYSIFYYAKYAQPHFLTPEPFSVVCHDIVHFAIIYSFRFIINNSTTQLRSL